jgi:hypothetical protein
MAFAMGENMSLVYLAFEILQKSVGTALPHHADALTSPLMQ